MADIRISDVVSAGVKVDPSVDDYKIRTNESAGRGYLVNPHTLATMLAHYYSHHFNQLNIYCNVDIEYNTGTGALKAAVYMQRENRPVKHEFNFKDVDEAFSHKTLATLSLLI